MNDTDFLIIGGGISAYSAGKKIRRLRPNDRVTMVTSDSLPPYDLPALSKEFLRGEKSRAELIYPSSGLDGVEIITSTPICALDVNQRKVQFTDGSALKYSTALIATGASPTRLHVPGADLKGVFYLRTAADAATISNAAIRGGRVVVVGAGFIGLEIAASLNIMGCDVTIIEAMDRIWPRFADVNVSTVVRKECEERGIRMVLGETVAEIVGKTTVTAVSTASGKIIPTDFVIVGIGITPNVDLARSAGIDVNDGIVVGSDMRTSVSSVYAAGDVANYFDPYAGRRMRGEHWGHAEYCGQLAATNMCGGTAKYDFMNYAWSDVFNLHIESTGHIGNYDQVVVRGLLDERKFTALYLKEGALVAYCAVNCEPVDFATYRKLIKSRQDLRSRIAELKDPDIRARTLI